MRRVFRCPVYGSITNIICRGCNYRPTCEIYKIEKDSVSKKAVVLYVGIAITLWLILGINYIVN